MSEPPPTTTTWIDLVERSIVTPGRVLMPASATNCRGVDHLRHHEHGAGLLCDAERHAPPAEPGRLPRLYLYADGGQSVTCSVCLEWLHA